MPLASQSLELALLDPAAVAAAVAAAAAAGGGGGDPTSSGSSGATASAAQAGADARAELLLDAMLGTLAAAPPPSLAHLLLGFDTTAPPGEWHGHALSPQLEFTCMTVLLRALQVRNAAVGGGGAGLDCLL